MKNKLAKRIQHYIPQISIPFKKYDFFFNELEYILPFGRTTYHNEKEVELKEKRMDLNYISNHTIVVSFIVSL